MKKRLFVLYLLLLSLILPLYSMTAETIFLAPEETVINMAQMRGLDTSGTTDEIRDRLYEYYGYDKAEINAESNKESQDGSTEESSYTLEIVSCDSVESGGNTIFLKGNVIIDFSSNEEEKKRLTSDYIVVDTDKKSITLLGKSKYSDADEKAAIKEIEADILTVFWENGDIQITDGSTTTERENSDKKKVTFSTSGERLSYLNEGAIVFDKGYITSDPDTAYSSISASTLMILPGEDMFMTNATFNIGRVPIFYFPFFFFPGSKILGNPSFGFDSDKGAFLNTSFELIGTYPKIESADESSSFSSLLKSTQSTGEEVRDGYYYSAKDDETEDGVIDGWAKKTNSYLVLLADSYSGVTDAQYLNKGGIHLGLDGSLSFFNKKLNISILTGVATPLDSENKKLRYYGNNSLTFSAFNLNLSLRYPYYSDRTVLYHYLNRLTGFSYGPLMGEKSEFPTDYSSSGLSSFTRSLTLSYSIPSSLHIPFVSSFSIKNLSLEGTYTIASSTSSITSTTSTTTTQSEKNSILSSYTLPSFSVSLSGTIISIDSSTFKKKTESADTPNSEESGVEEEIVDEESRDIEKESTVPDENGGEITLEEEIPENALSENQSSEESAEEEKTKERAEEEEKNEILLISPYTEALLSSSSSSSSKISLGYTITEDWSRKVSRDTTTDVDSELKLSSTTYSRVTLTGNIASFISINDVFTNSIVYTETNNYLKETWKRKTTYNPLNTLTVNLSYIGLTYNLSFKPFDYTIEESDSVDRTTESKDFDFTKDFIKTHSFVFSKTLSTQLGSFTGNLTYVLPPLDGSITPSIKWNKSSFNMTLSWLFKENDEDEFESNLISLALSYSSSYFVFSSTMGYKTQDLETAEEYIEPFTLDSTLRVKSKSGKYYIEEKIKASGITEGFIESINSTINLNYIALTLLHSRADEKLEFESLNLTSKFSSLSFQLWRGRIYFSFGMDSNLFINHRDRNKSYLTVSPNLTFSIAEFADVKFSFKTQNNKFNQYYEDDSFSIPLFFSDLKRSFDFFGDGRSNTSFILQNISIEMTHYMSDWNLNVKYTTSFLKGSDNGKTVYSLQPSLSIYLSWNTMPDLKAEENWSKDAEGTWTRK